MIRILGLRVLNNSKEPIDQRKPSIIMCDWRSFSSDKAEHALLILQTLHDLNIL